MALSLRYRKLDFLHPAKEPPPWSGRVDRWYQLDAAAFGLCELAARERESAAPPAFVFLASPGASNDTDFRFASGGASSPSKFVHTLPNVRGSALCQVLGWSGPTLCLQNDPRTIVTALEEACGRVGVACADAWVLSVAVSPEGGTAHLLDVAYGRGWERSRESIRIARERDAGPASDDDDALLRWLDPASNGRRFALGLGLFLERAS